MNWLQQNRFLGGFLLALALATILCGFFLLHEKSAAEEAQARLDSTVNELTRLRRSAPFPNEENLRKTRAQTDSYRSSLFSLEQEMKTRMFPKLPLQPNEFQSQLRAATTDVTEHAQAARVRLPDNFHLGFDEYATSLPNSLAAPRLGRQLRAIEWLADTIVEAHVDSLSSLTRTRLPEEAAAANPTPTPARARPAAPSTVASEKGKIVDWTTIDVTFSGSPASVRRAFNQIASAREQLYVLRSLRIKNQVDKGPPRGGPEAASVSLPPPAAPSGGAGKSGAPSISFIVGTEHVDVAAKIEIMKFTLPEKETR